MPLDDKTGPPNPLAKLRKAMHGEASAAEGAAAIAAIAEGLAGQLGLDLDAVFDAHQRQPHTRPRADTDWTSTEPADNNYDEPVGGYPGFWRYYKQALLIVRQRGGHYPLSGWYATADGVLLGEGRVFFPDASSAMYFAETQIDLIRYRSSEDE